MPISGRDLRAAREAKHYSLRKLASLTGWDPAYLSRVERGLWPLNPEIIRRYEKQLGHPIEETVDSTQPADTSLSLEDMDRRRFLANAFAAAGGGTLAGLSLETLPVPALPNLVGAAEVAQIEEAFAFCTDIDLRYGGGLATQLAHGSLKTAVRMLGLKMSDDTGLRLRSAVAALADRIAWSHYDNGDHDAAHRLCSFALSHAAQAEDWTLRGHAMLNYSTLAYDSGRRTEAAEMLRAVLGDDRIDPTERANLHIVLGRHCGGLGERQAALRHLGMAGEALAEPSTVTAPWARQVIRKPGHFDSAYGLAYFALDDDKRAREHFIRALDVLGDDRTRTKVRCLARVAAIEMRNGDNDSAEHHGRLAATHAKRLRSARVRHDLDRLAVRAKEAGLDDLAHTLKGAAA